MDSIHVSYFRTALTRGHKKGHNNSNNNNSSNNNSNRILMCFGGSPFSGGASEKILFCFLSSQSCSVFETHC